MYTYIPLLLSLPPTPTPSLPSRSPQSTSWVPCATQQPPTSYPFYIRQGIYVNVTRPLFSKSTWTLADTEGLNHAELMGNWFLCWKAHLFLHDDRHYHSSNWNIQFHNSGHPFGYWGSWGDWSQKASQWAQSQNKANGKISGEMLTRLT